MSDTNIFINQTKISHKNLVYAIVFAKNWFSFDKLDKPYYLLDEDYVVCQWHDFHDGDKSNIEGKTTIAICREYADAYDIYIKRLKKAKRK